MVAKQAQISKMELSARVKEDLKTVALGTSKINYLDPRITVAWYCPCAMYNMGCNQGIRVGATGGHPPYALCPMPHALGI